MRAYRLLSFLAVLAATGCATAPAQQTTATAALPVTGSPRVLPYPVELPQRFRQAVERRTRTLTGEPGPAYWQNRASYRLRATLHPDDNRLDGAVDIVYHNNSPDTLYNLHLDLTQNFHAPGAVRFEAAEVTGGIELRRVAVDRQTLGVQGDGARYAVYGTRLVILPPRAVPPGGSVSIAIEWGLPIPQAGAGERMGYGEDLFFLAYWYPHMTVYDDIVGWHPDPFVGTTEFYHGFGSYELTIDAPAGWVVMATGALMNPEQTLPATVLQRYRAAAESDTVVRILRAADFANATQRGTNGRLQWRFVSDSVRDVAFSATRRSNWDGMRTPVGDRNGDGRPDYTAIHSFWRASAPLWREVARYSAHAIAFFSRFLDMPYPWPHMTAVEGAEIIGGGMEFPMMTIMGDYNQRGDSALYYVTAHELAHMWFPMIVSSDERRYTWMDEGNTTFNENMARMDFFPGRNHHLDDMGTYLQIAGTDAEGEIMRRSAYHYDVTPYGIASYMKPATVLNALRGVLGEEVFMRAYREYARRWAYRHAYPWDMWHTFEHVSGRDLGWFWRSWYHETWTLDHAVAGVTQASGTTTIRVVDLGRVPMPSHLTITFADGRTEMREVPVEHWLAGHSEATVTVPTADVVRVEIDAALHFPDANRRNNTWRRQ
jgi:hypothetical protein